MIDRTLPVSGEDDVTKFGAVFSSATRRRLTDAHLWISVLSRPTRSNYTRVQRVSSILAILFLTMITSAMFYKTTDTAEQVIKFLIDLRYLLQRQGVKLYYVIQDGVWYLIFLF